MKIFSVSPNSVSFSSQNFVQNSFDFLNSYVDEKIRPFADNNKDLFSAVGKIGYNAQETLKIFSENEKKLLNYKLDIQSTMKNPKLGKFLLIEERFNQYESNKNTFKRLENLAQQPLYQTDDVKKALEQARKSFDINSPEISAFEAVSDKYSKTKEKYSDAFYSLNLLKVDKNMYDKLTFMNDMFNTASSYMLLSPYMGIVDTLKSVEKLKPLISDPKISVFDKEKEISRAQYSAEKVANDLGSFDLYKPKMIEFVEKNSDYIKETPSKEEINASYAKVFKEADLLSEKYVQSLNDIFDNSEMPDSGYIIATLKRQKQDCDTLQNAINKVKEEYIEKQNAEFFKNYEI